MLGIFTLCHGVFMKRGVASSLHIGYIILQFYVCHVPINIVVITVFMLRVVFMVMFMKLCLWCAYDKDTQLLLVC